MFTDNLKLAISAGKGGNGCIAWRREKYVPKGGPYGGDGGRGGSIIFKVDERLFSFENIRFKKKFIAENGKDGSSNNKKGRNGEDLIIKVPAGTIIKNSETKEEVFSFDLRKDNNPFILCKGGNGGFGNTRFKTPQNQANNQSLASTRQPIAVRWATGTAVALRLKTAHSAATQQAILLEVYITLVPVIRRCRTVSYGATRLQPIRICATLPPLRPLLTVMSQAATPEQATLTSTRYSLIQMV